MAEAQAKIRRSTRRLRCAVYTRKSSEEGLDQAFNSLDAQREACAAFITSQRHEGWILHQKTYDDGGVSGGTMERPALKRLIADIEAGTIDVVVVYKVDRLTRSLSDFAKLVDVFDKRRVSFVSITQQFNTTTSMGRLTLNVLLSFAQFEREVIGERVRDKIAASKKKGMWMGGRPPLGYDVRDRKLVVNDEEARCVVEIFRRYLALKSVHALRDALIDARIFSKQRSRADGSTYGGQPFGRGALYAMLGNRIYRGDVTHKGTAYPGEHTAIIEQSLWDEVQTLLATHRAERVTGLRIKQSGLLGGLLFDEKGERLTPTYAVKKGKRYRYYVSAALVRGRGQSSSGWRIPAADLDRIVVERLVTFLKDPTQLFDARREERLSGLGHAAVLEAGRKLADELSTDLQGSKNGVLQALVRRVLLSPEGVKIVVSRDGLSRMLGDGSGRTFVAGRSVEETEESLTLAIPTRLERAGREMRMLVEGSTRTAKPDASLLKIIARAHDLQDRLDQNTALTIRDIAQEQRLTPAYLYTLLRLRWLAPDITTAILEGRQPQRFNATTLMRHACRLPAGWADQRKVLGFS